MRRCAASLALLLAAAAATAQECPVPASMRPRLQATRSADTYADLGIALANQKMYACAADAFAASLKLKEDSANVLFMFGASLFFSGQTQDAVAPLQAAEQLDGRVLKQHLILAAVFDQLQRMPDAVAEWRAALAVDPFSSEALDGLSQDLVLQQDYAAAIQALTDPTIEGQRTAVQSLDLGLAYAGAGQLDQAVRVLEDGLNTTPDAPAITDALAGQMRALMASSPEQARTLGQALLAAKPENWQFQYLNAVLAVQAGALSEAKALLERSIALRGDVPLSHSLLGLVLLQQKDFRGAAAELERGIALGDASEETRAALAQARAAQ